MVFVILSLPDVKEIVFFFYLWGCQIEKNRFKVIEKNNETT